ncbi:uncharacterized protein VP01_11616g1, partial [Puccinia sorghi]
YLIIIEWLKIERNYDSCFGTWKAPAVGCPAKDEGSIQYLQRQAGICTINEKLESMCPHYHAMNELMHKLKTKWHHPLLSLLKMNLEAVTWKATDEDVVIPGVINKKAEKNLADETNK